MKSVKKKRKNSSLESDETLLDARQVAVLTGLEVRTLYYWASIGWIPSVRIPPRRLRFRLADIKPRLRSRYKDANGLVFVDLFPPHDAGEWKDGM